MRVQICSTSYIFNMLYQNILEQESLCIYFFSFKRASRLPQPGCTSDVFIRQSDQIHWQHQYRPSAHPHVYSECNQRRSTSAHREREDKHRQGQPSVESDDYPTEISWWCSRGAQVYWTETIGWYTDLRYEIDFKIKEGKIKIAVSCNKICIYTNKAKMCFQDKKICTQIRGILHVKWISKEFYYK